LGPDRLRSDSTFPFNREIVTLVSRTNTIIIRDGPIEKEELKELLLSSLNS